MANTLPRPLGYACLVHHPIRQRHNDHVNRTDMEAFRQYLKGHKLTKRYYSMLSKDGRERIRNDDMLPVINNARLSPLMRPINLRISGKGNLQSQSFYLRPSSVCSRSSSSLSNFKSQQYCDVMGPTACRDCTKTTNRTSHTHEHNHSFPDILMNQRMLCGRRSLERMSAKPSSQETKECETKKADESTSTDQEEEAGTGIPERKRMVTCTELQLRAMENTRRRAVMTSSASSVYRPRLQQSVVIPCSNKASAAPPLVTALRKMF